MAKTTYYRRKDAGLCPMCGGERTEVAFVQCVDCRQRDTKRNTPAARPGKLFVPTEDQIAATKAEIQEDWAEKTERQRRGASNAPVEFPVIRVI